MSEHVLGGRYRLQRQLGRGGMATVWRARDTRLDRSAAVKVLDPGWRADPVALERLRREAQSVARLAHQNIVGVYDFDVADNAAYLVMELVEGRNVTELLAMRGRLPVQQAVSIATQICDALGAAHAAGVVHRDIKPSNILVNPGGVVKVCDFGVALLQRAAYQKALTGIGAVVGTCQYMAPEQATGDAVDGRADLYAVGCLLYTMLAGAPPFDGPTPIDVLDMHLNEPPVPLRAHRDEVPSELDMLVGQLLAKDAADRPATAWSVRDRLTAIAGRTVESPRDVDPPTAKLPAYRPAQPTVVTSIPASTTPVNDTATGGRHRAMLVAVPVITWLRERFSGWVLALVAGAVGTVVLAAIVLASAGQQDTATAEAPPPLTATTTPDAEGIYPEPDPSSDPSESTPTSAAASATSASPTRANPNDQIVGLALILQQQVDAGQLQKKAARELLRDLNEVARLLGVGKPTEAAKKFAEFRNRVTELSKDGKLTAAGSNALPDLDAIAGSLAS